ncbi:MAG: Mrp/NBP35 family ATP-binding protein [Bacteroides sp.]|nr:MAG: Mrp/NBP35 family ATP-binding protein [Bacteroides sp.]
MIINQVNILTLLKKVYDPNLKKDLVSLNMIKDIKINDQEIIITLKISKSSNPLKNYFINTCKDTLREITSKEVKINIINNEEDKSKKNNCKIKNIILIASGKGGVGKSTVAANIAYMLSLKKYKVGILDADIYGPSIPVIFNILKDHPTQKKINDKNYIIPILKYNIKILSIGLFTRDNQSIPWRGPMVSSAVKQLFNDAYWGDLDYLIVDMPPGTGDIHITISQNFNATGAIIVTTPQKLSISDTIRSIDMFKMEKIDIPILGLIENMSYFIPNKHPKEKYYIFGKDGANFISKELNINILGNIPIIDNDEYSSIINPRKILKNDVLYKLYELIVDKI